MNAWMMEKSWVFKRGEAKQHISQISEYVKKADAMIPNAIVIAFRDDGIIFEKSEAGDFGTLKIPHDPNSNEVPGFIVDGQQRTMAIKKAIEDPKSEIQSFPMIVCAFIESDPAALIDQFVLINKSKESTEWSNLRINPTKYAHWRDLGHN